MVLEMNIFQIPQMIGFLSFLHEVVDRLRVNHDDPNNWSQNHLRIQTLHSSQAHVAGSLEHENS